MPISSQVRAMIRNTAAAWNTDTCTIERESETRGEFGEPIHAWEVVAVDVPCRVISVGQRYGSGVAEVGAAETMKREYRLSLGLSVELSTDMRVTINDVVYQITRIETQLTDEVFQHAIIQGRD